MAVRIRMKRMGRAHRPYFRICAVDKRAPRDGRVLEELGSYDPTINDTDARALLKKERIDYWLGVGAQPSEKVAVLIKKYGTGGTHVSAQETALASLAEPKAVPEPGAPASLPKSKEEPKQEEPAAKAEPEKEKPAEAAEETKAAADESGATETAADSQPAEQEAEPKEDAPASAE